ncbi:MAG: DUF1360 domain-containing protein [Acidobacteriota bacterium]|nr:DUF1360 domain-containing protein [Acidobacteriota bacterium]
MWREVALLSSVTGFLAFSVSETKLLAPFREWLAARSAPLGKLVSCGFCTGFWVAVALEAIYRPRLFHAWRPLDLALTAFVIAWLAAFQWLALCWLMDRAGK